MQQQFTGTDMLKIDIANCYGMDKQSWVDRLLWTELHEDELEDLATDADDEMLYKKAVYAHRESLLGKAIGHNMFLDATASGLQIMAALSGCKKTARHVNMVNTGKREDVYIEVGESMNKMLSPLEHVHRNIIKLPLMTHYYNKSKQPSLSETQQAAFYNILSNSFEGAEGCKYIINQFWDPTALEHTFTLPDGHVARVLVTDVATTRIEVDELDHTSFSYRFEANAPSKISTSLCPNVIHAIDGYIVREMIRRADKAGFELAHIFDAFTCHPNHMGKTTQFYREILAEIADSNLLSNILSEIAGKHIPVTKLSNDLSKDILASEYMLS